MYPVCQDSQNEQLSARALAPFFLITFGMCWGVFTLFFLLPGPLEQVFGPPRGSHPLFVLAVYSPAIAAFTLVVRDAGFTGLGRYLSRLFLWRCSAWWYAFLILGLPGVFFAGAALVGGLSSEILTAPELGSVFAAVVFMMVLGPVEEFGWRGFALPLLQRRLSPVWAAVLLGLVWGIWHLPAFFLRGMPQDGWSFAPFVLGCVAISLILTPLFNASRGSILLAAIFHFQLINPLWPDAQPYDTVILSATALVVLWLNRRSMIEGVDAVTAVIPEGHPPLVVRLNPS